MNLEDESRGWLSALDAATGKILWQYESDQPLVSAVMTSSGGLVFTGELNGNFLALDAETGAVLYRFNTGGPIGGGIASYALEGRQFVATVSGNASVWFAPQGAATVVIFSLPSEKR